ncbi:class I SAM-dependent methyltransferase [Mucilaginibacter aquatilis]|uniref:Methyltransferase domain-containing protein n=1 Tax=Mucilaginibacter aquatilis TaxID=1517760 RepID=A0A6I4I890_9SPHI|nr:class I SAM-dependent methyltransferase [Mucilaginibacter aquatilis]MVN91117.1 methyltransferase domain-containing protein [Mucilaginibacter aquatilis]
MKHSSEAFYNNFSFFYPLVDWFLKPQKRMLFEEVNQQPPGNLLEVGVGNGSHLAFYQEHDVTGIDTSEGMLKTARKMSTSKPVQLLNMDGEAMVFADASFDYIVLSHVIAVVTNPHNLLGEVTRVLKSGGKLFVLNHFTPANHLSIIDRLFSPVARLLSFRSVFYLNDIKSAGRLRLLKQIEFKPASYFKLLIFEKV